MEGLLWKWVVTTFTYSILCQFQIFCQLCLHMAIVSSLTLAIKWVSAYIMAALLSCCIFLIFDLVELLTMAYESGYGVVFHWWHTTSLFVGGDPIPGPKKCECNSQICHSPSYRGKFEGKCGMFWPLRVAMTAPGGPLTLAPNSGSSGYPPFFHTCHSLM